MYQLMPYQTHLNLLLLYFVQVHSLFPAKYSLLDGVSNCCSSSSPLQVVGTPEVCRKDTYIHTYIHTYILSITLDIFVYAMYRDPDWDNPWIAFAKGYKFCMGNPWIVRVLAHTLLILYMCTFNVVNMYMYVDWLAYACCRMVHHEVFKKWMKEAILSKKTSEARY